MNQTRVLASVLVWSSLACRAQAPTQPEPAPERAPDEVDEIQHVPDVEPEPAPLPAGPLQLSDLLDNKVGLLGVEVELEARIQWVTIACTASMPPSCLEGWKIIGARPDQRGSLELRNRAVPVPFVCKPNPNPSSLVAGASPCKPPAVLDNDQTYIFVGVLRSDNGGDYFEPTRVVRGSRSTVQPK